MTKEEAMQEINKAFEPAFANYIITALTEGVTISDKALEQQPSNEDVQRVVDYLLKPIRKSTSSEDCVSRDSIRLKIADMPKYTDGRKTASIRHLEDFLEKELGEQIEVTQDMCIGFTIALECIRDFITALPSVTPIHKVGKLITIDDTHSKCEECGVTFCITSNNEWEVSYCPNCGSKYER